MNFLDSEFGKLEFEDIGKWIEYSPNPDGTIPRIKIRRAHTRHRGYISALAATIKAKKKSENDLSDPEFDDVVMIEVYSKTIVLAWENFLCPRDSAELFGVGVGEVIPFSASNVATLFRARPRFWDSVYRKAQREDFFEGKREEELAKN